MTIAKKIAILMACTFSFGLGVAYFVLNSNLNSNVGTNNAKNNLDNLDNLNKDNINNTKIQITPEQQAKFPLLLDLQKNKVPFPNNGIRVINFWATWCDSCIREMPLLNKLQQDLNVLTKGKNATVLGIALDNPTDVKQYLQKQSLNYPTLLGGLYGMELMATLGNPQGNLPYTVVLNEKNEVIYQKVGEIKHDEELPELKNILETLETLN